MGPVSQLLLLITWEFKEPTYCFRREGIGIPSLADWPCKEDNIDCLLCDSQSEGTHPEGIVSLLTYCIS